MLPRWLRAEVTRLGSAERSFALRVHHTLALALVIVLVVLAFALGWFVSFRYPYKTVPRPPAPPGQVAPDCSRYRVHKLGGCLPRPRPGAPGRVADIASSSLGPDLSNNDPVYGDGAWGAIGARNSWVILKVNESTGYDDPTAKPMAAYAKRHRLVVGGYDFLHVCGPDPRAEARVFVSLARRDGVLGPGTFPGTADAEYGGSGCNARAWILSWMGEVWRDDPLHRWPQVYTGAWWWDPHLGCFWPNATAWISGYGVSYPYMPCGRSKLDNWQFADAGFNGASSGDLSVWRDGAAAFRAFVGGRAEDPYAIFSRARLRLGGQYPVVEYWTVRTWDERHCKVPVRRPVCGLMQFRLKLDARRLAFLAYHWPPFHARRHGAWGAPSASQPFGSRYQLIVHDRLRQ